MLIWWIKYKCMSDTKKRFWNGEKKMHLNGQKDILRTCAAHADVIVTQPLSLLLPLSLPIAAYIGGCDISLGSRK